MDLGLASAANAADRLDRQQRAKIGPLTSVSFLPAPRICRYSCFGKGHASVIGEGPLRAVAPQARGLSSLDGACPFLPSVKTSLSQERSLFPGRRTHECSWQKKPFLTTSWPHCRGPFSVGSMRTHPGFSPERSRGVVSARAGSAASSGPKGVCMRLPPCNLIHDCTLTACGGKGQK